MDSSSAEIRQGSENANGVEPKFGSSAELLTALDRLQESFDSKIKYDETRERQITELHEELQKHRRGLYDQIMEPLLRDLVGLHDDLSEFLTATTSVQADGRDLSFLLTAIDDILARYGVRSFSCDGETVERARQKVIDVVRVPDQELDRRIADRLRPGFELEGKVLRPEWVTAYCYTPPEG